MFPEITTSNPNQVFIERVVGPKSRRKQWYIVDRAGENNTLYPPRLSGPFRTLEAAKAAYTIIMVASSR